MSIFDSANRPGRDQASGWFKFTNIGDKIGGTIVDIFYKAAEGIYKEQRVFSVKNEETGEVVNVACKMNSYTLPRTDNLQIGDEVGFEYTKDVPSKTPGVQAAKSITIYSKLNGDRTSENAAKLGSPSGASALVEEDDSEI
jgi:hypothetical protein